MKQQSKKVTKQVIKIGPSDKPAWVLCHVLYRQRSHEPTEYFSTELLVEESDQIPMEQY